MKAYNTLNNAKDHFGYIELSPVTLSSTEDKESSLYSAQQLIETEIRKSEVDVMVRLPGVDDFYFGRTTDVKQVCNIKSGEVKHYLKIDTSDCEIQHFHILREYVNQKFQNNERALNSVSLVGFHVDPFVNEIQMACSTLHDDHGVGYDTVLNTVLLILG